MVISEKMLALQIQNITKILLSTATAAESALPRPVIRQSLEDFVIWALHRLALTQDVHGHVPAMTSVDFAAAQQRIEERRQRRAAVSRAHHESQPSIPALNVLSRLPFPLQGLGQYGIDVWNTIEGREGTRPAFRVGQVDAELLDEELLELLRGQVGEGLKYFGVR